MRLIVFFIAICCFGISSAEDDSTETIITDRTPTSVLYEIEETTLSSTTSATDVLSSSSTSPQPTTTEAEKSVRFTTVPQALPALSPSTTKSSFSATTPSTSTSAQRSTQKITTKTLSSFASTPATTKNNTPTTSPPKVSRSRSRQTKKLDNTQQAELQLIPLTVTKSEASGETYQQNAGIKKHPGKSAVRVLHSEPHPQLYGNQKISMHTSNNDEPITAADKADIGNRRGKVRYLTGKELGRDDPAINFHSKYEADKFKFSYETKDGQSRFENGVFENIGAEDQNYVVTGSYSYFDDEGIEYVVNYTADTRGYRPVITVNNPNRA